MEKALFVPLTRRWFEAVARGEKTVEYRRLGWKWNAETCRVGRDMLISCGYGKARRIRAVITRFEVLPFWRMPFEVREFFQEQNGRQMPPQSRLYAAIHFRKATLR